MGLQHETHVTPKHLSAYALLALPLAFAGLPIYVLAPDFYATYFEIGLATLGVGLLILRLLDAVIDPLLGSLVDLYVHNARSIAITSGAVLCLGFFMLFSPPKLGAFYVTIWFFAAVFIVTLAFSLLTILYGATGAVWSDIKAEQTKITTSREALTLVGMILAISIPTTLALYFSLSTSYLIQVCIFVPLFIVCLALYLRLQDKIVSPRTLPVVTAKANQLSREKHPAQSPTSKRAIWFLYGCYGFSALASAVPAVLVVFFVRDYLGSQTFIGLALTIYFFAGALSMPFWHWLATKIGKIRAWQCSMLLAVLSFSWVLLLNPGDLVLYAVICLFSGFALGAEMALPPAILSEFIQSSANRSAALKYSGLSFISKLSLSLAAGICLPLLGVLGFEPGRATDQASLNYLLYLYAGLPGALKIVALALTQIWIFSEPKDDNFESHKTFTNLGSVSDG